MTEESPWYGKNVERKMTVFFDKINKSILFVPKMKMDITLTLDGEKISEFVFDNTQDKKHIKFFYSPDAYTKDYLYEEEWEYPGFSGIKCKVDFKRGGVSTYNYDGEYSWVNNANKFEVKSNEKANQEANGPYYGMDYWLVGTSFLVRSTSRARLWLMERGSTRPSWTPGPPPTPWSGSTSLSGPSTQPQEISPARMR